MKGFTTREGDVVIGKTIELSTGAELLRQKAGLVVCTNQGEWAKDIEEGIDFSVILRKNPDRAEIMGTIEAALKRIDETFVVTDLCLSMQGRNATINFTAVNGDGVEVGGAYTYGN